MQLNTKNFLVILLLGVATVYLYYGFHGEESLTQTDTQKQIASAELVETDTGKRLETFANSGTDWGMTPFGSGKPLEEVEEEKPKFVKPNTEWKTRTISGVTYVFGEGNPAGATPLSEEEMEAYKKCYYNTVVHAMDCPPVHQTGIRDGYVTPDIEHSLIELISHPSWEKVLLNCEQQFRQYEYPDWGMSYDQVMYQNALNLENMLTIDPDTGRKTIFSGTFLLIYDWLRNALTERDRGPMYLDFSKIDNCISQNGGTELYQLMSTIDQKQYIPDGNYSGRIIDITKHIP